MVVIYSESSISSCYFLSKTRWKAVVVITLDQKQQLLRSYVGRLQDMLATAQVGASEAQKEANQHVGAMASRYDTFKEESQYLTAGYNRQIIAISSSLALATVVLNSEAEGSSNNVSLGNCIGLLNYSKTSELRFFLSSELGGEKFNTGELQFIAVTIASPIGQLLLGCNVGDKVLFPNRSEEFEIDWII